MGVKAVAKVESLPVGVAVNLVQLLQQQELEEVLGFLLFLQSLAAAEVVGLVLKPQLLPWLQKDYFEPFR